MRRPTLPSLPDRDAQVLCLCEEHLGREEALVTDVLQTLREVRDAFVRRDLTILATLQKRQERLDRTSQEIDLVRNQLRESLAPLLGVAPEEVTLRAAALSLGQFARARLLHYHEKLADRVREAEQLSRHNAALLGYAREFLDCLFASLTGAVVGERYGPQGQRPATTYGSFLEARA